MEVLKKSFIAPSGFEYTIREENGSDEEILSNVQAIKDLTNLTNFIASIVVGTDATKSGKLTPTEALQLPLLDRYTILMYNRIFSLGETLDFAYTWPNGQTLNYEQDLTEMILSDYSNPDSEEVKAKPDAIPGYSKDLQALFRSKSDEDNLNINLQVIRELKSGKRVSFNILNGYAEKYMAKLTPDKQTRNSVLLARDLKIEVDGKMEKVEAFSHFTVRELAELHKLINDLDPMWDGTTEIENPTTGEKDLFPIISAPHFFFLTEA